MRRLSRPIRPDIHHDELAPAPPRSMLPMTRASNSPSSSGAPTTGSDPTSEGAEPAMAAAPMTSSAAAPSGPQTASVTIRSSCSRTAKVFYGEKPGFSSGTTSSVSSNSVSSKTFKVGDQMWVLDDSGKALGNVTISASTRQIEIDASCSSMSAR
jgi:hypothetical protein